MSVRIGILQLAPGMGPRPKGEKGEGRAGTQAPYGPVYQGVAWRCTTESHAAYLPDNTGSTVDKWDYRKLTHARREGR